MKSIIHSIAAFSLMFMCAANALADGDYFAPTIDPTTLAPGKLNGPEVMQPTISSDTKKLADTKKPTDDKKADAEKSADDKKTDFGVDPYDVGAELTDNQVQLCVTPPPAICQPPVPPPDLTNTPAINPAPETSGSAPASGTNSSATSSGNSSGACNTYENDGGCHPWWVQVDYLALWIQANHLPPLVTASPPGTPQAEAGVLSNPNTTILFGNQGVDGGARNGGRVTLGYWFDDDEINGLRASWFTVGKPTGSADFFANSTGTPTLARPFNNSDGTPNAQLAAYTNPGNVVIVMGQPGTPATIGVTSISSMDFAEIAFSHVFERDSNMQLGWIAGYRHLEFRERLTVFENSISLSDPLNPTELNVNDQFHTANDFEGGQLGTEFTWNRNRWTLEGSARLGLGNVNESVSINGTTTATDSLGNVTTGPGLLAQPTNDGVHVRNVFGFLPELELKLHCELTEQIDLTFGYTFLLLTRVARVGDQIDESVSSTTLPTAVPTTGIPAGSPAEVLRDTSMWAQGISGGIEFRF